MCPPKYLPKKPKIPALQIGSAAIRKPIFPKGRIEPEHGADVREVPVVVFVVTALVVLAVSFLRAYLKETGVL